MSARALRPAGLPDARRGWGRALCQNIAFDVLTLTGSATIIRGGPELGAFEGTDRLLQFEVESGFHTSDAAKVAVVMRPCGPLAEWQTPGT